MSFRAFSLALVAALLAGCAGSGPSFSPNFSDEPPAAAAAPQAPIGNAGGVRVGLILPLGAKGNAGSAAQSMRNAAELALAEFSNPSIQLIVKDDGGTAHGAQAAAEQLMR